MRRIGVVGPAPSVERILAVAKELDQNIEFVPFTYEEAHETINIVKTNHSQVKGWLCSGSVPFMLAKKALGSDDNLAYCPSTGASLYRCFLQMAHYQKKLAERVSIDVMEAEDVEEALLELGIPTSEVFIKKHESEIDHQELVQFHLQLLRNGKVDGVITSLHSVYLALKKEGYFISYGLCMVLALLPG